jgi:hypothetical protein
LPDASTTIFIPSFVFVATPSTPFVAAEPRGGPLDGVGDELVLAAVVVVEVDDLLDDEHEAIITNAPTSTTHITRARFTARLPRFRSSLVREPSLRRPPAHFRSRE